MQIRLTVTTLFLLLFLTAENAHAESQLGLEPTSDPMLRIDADRHTGWIKRIGFDRECHYLVTGGRDDKTARLWEFPATIKDSPTLAKKFRHPIGQEDFGKVYAVDISPDGKVIALGGWDVGYVDEREGKNYVYIFETSTGDLLKRIGGFKNVIHHLSFSPDGQFLVAGLHGTQGIGIWKTSDWSLIPHNGVFRGSVYGALFDDTNHLYTISEGFNQGSDQTDGSLQVLGQTGSSFEQMKIIATHSGRQPYAIAMNPTNHRVAIGYSDVPSVDVYDGETLQLLELPPLGDIPKDRISQGVSWSTDGSELYAAFSPESDFGPKFLRIWGDHYQNPIDVDLPLPPLGSIVQLRSCKSTIVIAANEGFGFLDSKSKQLTWLEGSHPVFTVDKGDVRQRIRVSKDGLRIAFTLRHGKDDFFIFDVERQGLDKACASDMENLQPPDTHSLPIADWEFSLSPKLNNRKLPLQQFERAMSLAISPEKKWFILGTEWGLHKYDIDGKPDWCDDPRCNKGLPGEGAVIDLNISGDGRLVISAHTDGIIRWRRISDGRILLSLFVNKQDKRWIAWTPKGYFMASVGGEELSGWHVNRGFNQKADFYSAHVFREHFLRPDILKLVLQKGDEDAATSDANMGKPTSFTLDAPVVDIRKPEFNGSIDGDFISVEYIVRSSKTVTKLEFKIDGSVRHVIKPFDTKNINQVQSIQLPFPPGGKALTVTAYSESLYNPTTILLNWTGKSEPVDKPKLFALVIGIDNYVENKLAFPAKDAEDVANLIKNQPHGKDHGLYRDIDVRLFNKEVTRQTILLQLIRMKDDMKNEAEANGGKISDIAIIFYSGHGTVSDSKKFFLMPPRPKSINGIAPLLQDYGVSEAELKAEIEEFPGLKVLIMDACRAGSATFSNFNITSFINDLSDVTFVYSSTGPKDLSYECERHGCFTQALIDGINGEADKFSPFGLISTDEMDSYLTSQVPILRKAQGQIPMMHKSYAFSHFKVFKTSQE